MSKKAKEQAEPSTTETIDWVQAAADAAADKKAAELVILDLREIASFTEYFLICSGSNQRQVQAIADAVEERLRKEKKRPLHIEGHNAAEWILLDYGDFIVHVFSATSRKFYDLERLWRDAKRIDATAQQTPQA